VSNLVLTYLSSVSLTGLLSFMLSDEMTTGSVTSTVPHKQVFAMRSHNWNMTQTRFRDAFPDVSSSLDFATVADSFYSYHQYCTATLRDLPNMGEKERGKPSITLTSIQPTIPRDVPKAAEEITRVPTDPPPAPVPGWMTAWRHFVYEKWRLCAFIALAVMVSRISSRA